MRILLLQLRGERRLGRGTWPVCNSLFGDFSHRDCDRNVRRAVRLIGPAGAVQAGQFAPVKIRHVLGRIDLQPWLWVWRQWQIHRSVDNGARKERPCEKGKKDDRENR
jgi:hypothetical protein